jgi:2-polyprenyl-3-methyl-5-hydroxy-6-metoxy-1,4-benzoquinol methylase
MKQTPLHENLNTAVLDFIPHDSCKIIDVGCMSGILAREFKKINPDCFYIGVDIMQEYVEVAKKYCDGTYVLDIEKDIKKVIKDNPKIDCWVMGDILEHLVDPWSFLKKICAASEPGTNFVICIPNFQHWTIQYKLILGNIFYEDSGLLDRSHLRIFTRKSLINFINQAGLQIKKIKFTTNGNPLNDPDFNNLVNFAVSKGYNKNLFLTESLAYQYVLLAQK